MLLQLEHFLLEFLKNLCIKKCQLSYKVFDNNSATTNIYKSGYIFSFLGYAGLSKCCLSKTQIHQ